MTNALMTIMLAWGAAGTQPAPEADTVIVQATGMGRARAGLRGPQARLMAERAAQVGAVRNLRAKLGGLSSRGGEGAEQFHVEGEVRGHRFGPTRFREDGTAEVTVEVAVPRAGISGYEPDVPLGARRDSRVGACEKGFSHERFSHERLYGRFRRALKQLAAATRPAPAE